MPYQFSRDFPNESSQAPESMPQLGIDRKARYVIWVGDLEAGPRPGRGGAASAQRAPRVRFSGLQATPGPIHGPLGPHGPRVRFSVAPPHGASASRMRAASYSARDIADLTWAINSTPRKCLGFKTPAEAFLENINCCT